MPAPVRNVAATHDAAQNAYMPLKKLAHYAGLSVRTLRKLLARRQAPLPYYRIGGKILVRRADFDAWASRFRRDADSVAAIVDDIMEGFD